MRDTWGTPPHRAETLTEWATTAAERRAEDDPRVIAAAQVYAAALMEMKRVAAAQSRHANECARRIHGTLDRTSTHMEPNRDRPSLGR